MQVSLSLSQVNLLRLILNKFIDLNPDMQDSLLTDLKEILCDLDSSSTRFIQSL